MKTMTCRQMGGPCDAPIQGSTVEEMSANGAKHLQDMANDSDHQKALEMMNQTMADPEANKKWSEEFAEKFNAAPAE